MMGQVLTSCGGDEGKGAMSFSEYSLTAVADGADSDSLRSVFANFDGRCSVSVSGVLPERLGEKNVEALRDSLCRLANVELDEKGKIAVVYPSELKELSKAISDTVADGRKPGSVYENKLSLAMLTPKLAVFNSYMYSYPEGAAHGVWTNSYVNYDIESGKILTTKNIFTTDYHKLLVPAIINKLKEQDLEFLVEESEIKMPKQFCLTPSGIDFIYGLYEITPYSEGEVTAHFTYAELSSILRPEAKALFLGDE